MKIAIIDDHKLFRDGLKSLFSKSNVSIVAEAINGVDLIDKLKSLNKVLIPDIFIVDVNMPIMDGFETVDWLRTNYPDKGIIILSMRSDTDTVLRMVRLGVKSYLTKDINVDILLNAIKMVQNQQFYFPEEITSIIVNSLQEDKKNEKQNIKLSELSEREIQFMKQIATEKTYKEIAIEMKISLRTVDGYRDALFSKLNVNTRVGLAFMAIKFGLVSI